MMPKGGEHLIGLRDYSVVGDVRIPMMPKGVEHRGVSEASR